MDQVTEVLLDPVTVAFSVVDCPPVSVAEVGESETVTDVEGVNDIFAVAVLVLSAALAAVTVTVCEADTVAGAVYTPFVTVPTAGDSDQFTAVLVDPLTVALSVVDFPPVRVAVVGETEIETGTRDNVTLAVLLVAAWLVAVTVTVSADGMTAGA